jgi:hypothetical protein
MDTAEINDGEQETAVEWNYSACCYVQRNLELNGNQFYAAKNVSLDDSSQPSHSQLHQRFFERVFVVSENVKWC